MARPSFFCTFRAKEPINAPRAPEKLLGERTFRRPFFQNGVASGEIHGLPIVFLYFSGTGAANNAPRALEKLLGERTARTAQEVSF